MHVKAFWVMMAVIGFLLLWVTVRDGRELFRKFLQLIWRDRSGYQRTVLALLVTILFSVWLVYIVALG